MRSCVQLFAVLACFAHSALAQTDVTIEAIKAGDGVHMLVGQGGNIGVSTGSDGAFVIDDQFAPLTDSILAAIWRIDDKPVRFVVNTHWHGDHTGGNENMGRAGALIVAHENVRARMSVEQFMEAFGRTVPASPPGALPVVTFTDAMTFHWNDEEIHIFHVAHAHTDGDAIIHFRRANVLHMGDTYFKGRYPFIDLGSGGSIDGVIAAADQAIALADDQTRIIPGHGGLSNRAELTTYRDVLIAMRDKIQAMAQSGMSKDAVIAAKPTQDYDAEWGVGFMKPDQWVGIVFDSLKE